MNKFPEHEVKLYVMTDLWGAISKSKDIGQVRLNKCQAYVCKPSADEDFVYLESYGTIVAVYDRYEDALYDVLRTEYGFTKTSAQHISKFEKLVEPAKLYRTYYKDDKMMYRRIY